MIRVEYHPQANQELAAAALFYHQQAVGLGGEFLDEVEHAESVIVRFPEAGRLLRGDTRRISLRRFPFALIYQARGEHLWILAVAHERRRPGYWAARQAR